MNLWVLLLTVFLTFHSSVALRSEKSAGFKLVIIDQTIGIQILQRCQCVAGGQRKGGSSETGSPISCGLARPRSLVGGKPTQAAVSRGPGIEPCRCTGNSVLDA